MELTSGFVLNMEYPNWEPIASQSRGHCSQTHGEGNHEAIAPKLMVKEDTI